MNPEAAVLEKTPARVPRGQPMYRRIADVLCERVAQGAYAVGQNLPTEVELCEEFSASHHTVRDALKILVDKGLIVRRAGAGSTVIALRESTVFTHVVVDLRELVSYPETARRENLEAEHILSSPEESRLLRCPAETSWFRIGAVRRVDTMADPVCWTYFYLLPRYAHLVRNKDHTQIPVYQQIERLGGERVERVRIETSIGRVPPHIATVLRVEAGSPAMVIVRRYLDAGDQALQTTVSLHPEGRYTSTLEFKRERRNR